MILLGVPLESKAVYPEGFVRPRTRQECEDGPRPCPLVGCPHNNYLEVIKKGKALRVAYGERAPEDVPPEDSCDLDVAMEGGATLERVAMILGVTRERVRQLEVLALMEVRRHAEQLETDHHVQPSKGLYNVRRR
jgi:hypothetical protein